MTLDEAIKHAEEVADNKERQVVNGDWEKGSLTEKHCIECANEHRQLAEWLKELKEYRKMPIDKEGILKTLQELRQEFVEELESLRESYDWGRVYGMEIAIEMVDHKIEEVQNDD